MTLTWARHRPCSRNGQFAASQVRGDYVLVPYLPTEQTGAVCLEKDERQRAIYVWCACGCRLAPLILLEWDAQRNHALEQAMRQARDNPEQRLGPQEAP